MSARAWVTFAAVSVLWGIPYLFIKIAVDDGVPPAFVAWSRVVLAAAILLLLAWRAGALEALRGKWRWLAVYAFLEISIPFPMIAFGEQHVASSLAAIIIAAVPLFIALLGLMDLARIVRSSFMSLREREYVEAAHALGASDRRIIMKHLIPNSLGQIIVWGTLGAATAVITEAALSYLGYGVSGSDTSLVSLVAVGAQAAETRPWLFYFPGLTLLVILLFPILIYERLQLRDLQSDSEEL